MLQEFTSARLWRWLGGATVAMSLLSPVAASGADQTPQEWKNEIGMEFVLVPAGTFRMGVSGRGNKDPFARPAHEVTITRPFYIGRYEVTQAEWQAVMGINPSHFHLCGGRCPVENISWNDTQTFIEKLNDQAGADLYRLPTEAEWEYAARGGLEKVDRYGPVKDIAWTRSNGGGQTHPVGGKTPNGYGLYDTLGNVAEWVGDWFGSYTKEAQSDPTGPAKGKFRVRRGHCGIGKRGNAGMTRVGCKVEYRGHAPRNFSTSDSGGGGVSVGLSITSFARPPKLDRGIGLRLLRVVE